MFYRPPARTIPVKSRLGLVGFCCKGGVIMKYKEKTNYTSKQLRDYKIQDLTVDYKCAIRDGLPEYAEEVRQQLIRLYAEID
jgi:hypothetical protein